MANRIQTKCFRKTPKNNLNTADSVIEDIISEMPLEDEVRTANLDEYDLIVLQLTLGK